MEFLLKPCWNVLDFEHGMFSFCLKDMSIADILYDSRKPCEINERETETVFGI